MEWFTVIALIIIGLGLILVEIIFVPGTTVVGIIGFIGMVISIYLGYSYFGNRIGTLILIASGLLSLGVVVWAFRTRAWERFSLKNTSKSRFNEDITIDLKVGDEGISVSTLKPIGKAEFNDKEYEVSSIGDYITEGNKIKIIRMEGNKIYVEIY